MAKCLAHIDSFNVFDRDNGFDPFLVLDGHHSRFELPFLKYIHDEEHLWHTCIGVPYASQWWQLADSSEVNGNYKMGTMEAKRLVFTAKQGKQLQKTDIIPIVNQAWKKSFARLECVKKAIVRRGWNPLNYALMTNPKLVSLFEAREKPKDPPASATAAAITVSIMGNESLSAPISVMNGTAGTYLDNIIREQMRNEGKRAQIRKKREEEQKQQAGLATLQSIMAKKRLT